MNWRGRGVYGLAAAFVLLVGCAKQMSPEVSDQSVPLRQPESEIRTVIAGDTLYSIAWESGRDHRELATWNGISPPYTIVPGQKLRLFAPAKTSDVSRSASAVHTVQRGETLFSIATRYDLTVADLCAWNKISPPYTIERGQKLRVIAPGGRVVKRIEPKSVAKPTSRKTAPTIAKSKTPDISVAKPPPASATQWTWPANGALVKTSNASTRGINVTGKRGQTIVAASPGTVVYQGSGLRGYGQLIILKHNSDFLSAYAHCDKIVVREGDVIKRGQKIAEMGSTGADSVKLHFEIRYRGTPVDPLTYLPRLSKN